MSVYIYICIYIFKLKATKHFFFYKYFDVFTKSCTVHMDQKFFYKKIYSKQQLKVN